MGRPTTAEDQRWALALGLAVVLVLSVTDALWSAGIATTVVIAPFLCALRGTPRQTAVVGVAATLSAALSATYNGNPGLDYGLRLVVVALGGTFAYMAARTRSHLARDHARFRMLAAVADISDTTTSPAGTLERLGDILTPDLADICVIDVLREGRVERLAVAAHGPRSAEITAGLRRRGTRGATTEANADALVRGYDDVRLRELALDDEDLAFLRSLEVRSGMTVPLRARGRRIGTLALATTRLSGREYDADDLEFARVLAGRVALALDNAGLFSEVETLVAQQAAALGNLAEAVTIQDTSGALVYANAAAAVALDFDSVDELLAASPAEIIGRFDTFLEDGTPLRPELMPGRRVLAGQEATPLVTRSISKTTGEERWRVTKASAVRDAEGNVRLAVNVIDDVTDVKRVELAQRLLAEAGAVLTSSLDYEETLAQVARLAIGDLADWCGVVLPGEHGYLRSVAVAHVDPERVRYARELNERWPARIDDPTGAAEVIRSGESQVVNTIPDELFDEAIEDPEHRAALREIGMHSAMIVPMIAAGRTIGAITFVTAESRRTFTDADRQLAEELGRRAGTAVQNARLYTERSHIAMTLQSSLLPAALPAVPGFALASLYRPAGAANWVGGDFYDAFETTAGWMVVVGDVAGRGAEAAALTGQARHTLRTAATLLDDPMGAVAHLNQALTEMRRLSLCTVAVLHLVQREGGLEATVICAGHPQPYLVRDGVPRAIGTWGPMVGAFAESTWKPETLPLRPGDVVVLYTDGVIDAGGPDERFGDTRLEETLTGVTDATDAVARIRVALERFETGEQADDTAVLAIAYTGDRSPVR